MSERRFPPPWFIEDIGFAAVVLPLHQFMEATVLDYCAFAGVSGRTAATPSGLMLKAKKVKGSPPGFPH
jgi:hypothetical protein